MAKRKVLYRISILLLVMLNIGCDQVTKNLVRDHIAESQKISIIKDHFTLTRVENSGAFLSAGDSLPLPLKFILLNALPLIVLIYGLYFLMAKSNLPRPFLNGIACVIGGGIGNLYDRFLYGSVTDFLHIDFVLFKTGVFNVADMSIMVGMAIIIVYGCLNKKPQAKLLSD